MASIHAMKALSELKNTLIIGGPADVERQVENLGHIKVCSCDLGSLLECLMSCPICDYDRVLFWPGLNAFCFMDTRQIWNRRCGRVPALEDVGEQYWIAKQTSKEEKAPSWPNVPIDPDPVLPYMDMVDKCISLLREVFCGSAGQLCVAVVPGEFPAGDRARAWQFFRWITPHLDVTRIVKSKTTFIQNMPTCVGLEMFRSGSDLFPARVSRSVDLVYHYEDEAYPLVQGRDPAGQGTANGSLSFESLWREDPDYDEISGAPADYLRLKDQEISVTPLSVTNAGKAATIAFHWAGNAVVLAQPPKSFECFIEKFSPTPRTSGPGAKNSTGASSAPTVRTRSDAKIKLDRLADLVNRGKTADECATIFGVRSGENVERRIRNWIHQAKGTESASEHRALLQNLRSNGKEKKSRKRSSASSVTQISLDVK